MKTHKPMPPMAFILEKLRYDESTGDLIWLSGPRKGKVAGSKMKTGRQLEFTINGERTAYLAHRIIWFIKTGEDPGDKTIDHKDGDSLNNLWDNLRKATYSENGKNKKCSTNSTGFTGVVKRGNRYMAYAYCDGKQHIFGRRDTPEEAHQLYLRGVKELFGEFNPSERYDSEE
ncbi:putative homing endonuclease [Escherichia phage DaisyDussoix]|uniref:HNH endonuclease n=2 Tax=Tequintavirus TaxID=187218 RepID=A0AAE9HMP4_9CAUD|nr:putative homing endonuclease [Escherichia phage DaisyDussoix]UPW38356.1 HNH endonuclease [Escherichia phage vB_EcoS_ESCO30]